MQVRLLHLCRDTHKALGELGRFALSHESERATSLEITSAESGLEP